MFDDIDFMYEGTVIRPPSEADSLILQVTLGCSDNHCSFCPAYKEKSFKIKSMDRIDAELKRVSGYPYDFRKVFLADGDAMCIPQDQLLEILERVNIYFPSVKRIGLYASSKSLLHKNVSDLIQLKQRKLGIVYLGVETGDPVVYESTAKFGNPDITANQCAKIREAEIKLNTTVILGLGGKKYSDSHIRGTVDVLNRIQPDHIAALTLMIVEGTALYEQQKRGLFQPLLPMDYVGELYHLIRGLGNFRCLFFSNHASNYYSIEARFPSRKKEILDELEELIKGHGDYFLKPEFMRAL